MLMPTSSATSRTVKRRFPRITERTLSTRSSFDNVEGRPGLGSSSTDILPSLKRLNHSYYCVRLIQSSPYSWLSNWKVSVKLLLSLQLNFAHTQTHTLCSSSSFIVTLSLIRRTACERVQFRGFSSTTNAHSETGEMAVCCQNLTIGALCNHSELSVLVGALFKKFGPFLNMPRITVIRNQSKHVYFFQVMLFILLGTKSLYFPA